MAIDFSYRGYCDNCHESKKDLHSVTWSSNHGNITTAMCTDCKEKISPELKLYMQGSIIRGFEHEANVINKPYAFEHYNKYKDLKLKKVEAQ